MSTALAGEDCCKSIAKTSGNVNKYNFAGRHCVVTGAGKGIGLAVTEALLDAGASVLAVSRTADDLDRLQASLTAEAAGRLNTAAVDLADCHALQQTLEGYGDIDFLVNNAGVALCSPLLETKVEDFDTTMAVNVRAALVGIQVVARNLIARRASGGAIVNVSSQASTLAFPSHTSYCASKAAMDMLTKSTALELGPHGIRCNAVNPTVVMTAMGRANWSDPNKAGPMLRGTPLGRFAEVDEVVKPILFLLSEQAGMVTGHCMPVEGGFLSCATLAQP